MSYGLTVVDVLERIRSFGLEKALSRYYSLYPSKITNDEDSAQVGRAKVRVQSLGFQREHPKQAWPVSPYAGRNYGFYFPPHTGDQVYTSFGHGNVNCPRLVGSFWLNEDDALKPTTSHVPAEFVDADGGSPSKRGIKSRGGSVLIFDDEADTYHVEIYSGSAPTEEVEGRTRPKVGELSKKHHSVLLDDANEEVVISTFGELPEGREDTDDQRIKHKLIMRDKDNDRFVLLKSIGEVDGSDEKYHQMLLSDTEQKIRAESAQEHFWEIDDENNKITCSTKNGFLWELDQRNKTITVATAEGQQLTFNDQTATNTLETPNNQSIVQNSSGTTITENNGNLTLTTTGDKSESVGGSVTQTVSGDVNINVTGSWIAQVASAARLLATGALTLQGVTVDINANASVSITSPSVAIGSGSQDFVVKQLFGSAIYNPHTHVVTGPFPGVAIATTSTFVPGLHSTVATKIA